MKSRDDVIEKILGEGAVAKLRAGVQDEKEKLDKAGVEHKALAQKGALEKLSELVDGFIAKLTDQPVNPETKQEFISLITTMLTPATTEEVAPEPEMVGQEPEMMKSVKLNEMLIQTQEQQAQDLSTLSAAVKALLPLTTLAEALNGVRDELKAVKGDITLLKIANSGKSRIASKDDGTVIAVDDKELAQKAKEQLNTLDSFWGRG